MYVGYQQLQMKKLACVKQILLFRLPVPLVDNKYFCLDYLFRWWRWTIDKETFLGCTKEIVDKKELTS